MNSKPTRSSTAVGNDGSRRLVHEVEGAATAAIAGAVFGSFAGPPGAVAGAILGGAVGAVVSAVLDSEDSRRADHTRELDAEIGESDLGETDAPTAPTNGVEDGE